jgi:hypothetical protein
MAGRKAIKMSSPAIIFNISTIANPTKAIMWEAVMALISVMVMIIKIEAKTNICASSTVRPYFKYSKTKTIPVTSSINGY